MTATGPTDSPSAPAGPPVGEEVHLPGPSLVPIVNAFGISLALVGLAVNIGLTVVGGIIFVLSLVRWIRDTRRDLDDLPLEH